MAYEAAGDSAFSVSAEQAVGPYLRAVRRHWRLVAVVSLLTVLVSAITVSRIASSYSSSASILVTPLPEGSAGFVGIGIVVDTGNPGQTVQTAAALIDTPNAAAAAAKALGPAWTASSVFGAVTVTPQGASDVLLVTATASTPRDAQRVANAFATAGVAYRASVVQAQIAATLTGLEARIVQLQHSQPGSAELAALATAAGQLRGVQGTGGEPTLSLSQTAQLPTSSNGTSRALVLFLALVGGFALASVAALGLEAFSRPVRDREELESIYPIPVLAALPKIRGRRRVHGMPPWTLPPDAFEQLRMLRVQLSLAGTDQVIMVTSAGAGDGKTTVTAALAAAFAEGGQSVILIDLDLRKPDLERLLQVESRSGLNLSQSSGVPLAVPNLPGVELLPVPRGDITMVETVMQRLPLLIAQSRREADVVLIDTAPVGEVSEALRIAGMCDQVVFVARPRLTDRRRLLLARDLLDRAGARPVGMVLVGKETGLPKGDHGYAYEIGTMGPPPANGATKAGKRPASVAGRQSDVGADFEQD
jgi:Mrp family chromosome partitioning ATPase/capsular polysaccharide biosynthesis protein